MGKTVAQDEDGIVAVGAGKGHAQFDVGACSARERGLGVRVLAVESGGRHARQVALAASFYHKQQGEDSQEDNRHEEQEGLQKKFSHGVCV